MYVIYERKKSKNRDALIAFFFFQAEDGIRDIGVTGVQTCALPISSPSRSATTSVHPASSRATVTDSWTVPTSGCPSSIPLSSTHTRMPAPREPPHAHSRVTGHGHRAAMAVTRSPARLHAGDRNSTRLNSSHANISYAVFCLKKKRDACYTD